MSDQPKPKMMLCFGEYRGGWGSDEGETPMRLFNPLEKPEALLREMSREEFDNLPTDYSCSSCGWCQSSVAGGALELCTSATWWNWDTDERTRAMYGRLANIARSAGFEVPDVPPQRADDPVSTNAS